MELVPGKSGDNFEFKHGVRPIQSQMVAFSVISPGHQMAKQSHSLCEGLVIIPIQQ